MWKNKGTLLKIWFVLVFFLLDNGELLSQILAERCDGNRNLLHACVSVCAPVSNKEHDNGKVLYYIYF